MMTRRERRKLVFVTALLLAGVLAWTAVPAARAAALAKPSLIAGACCGVGAVVRLAIGDSDSVRLRGADLYAAWPVRLWRQVAPGAATVPWAQLTILAVLACEALNPRRPWHTVVLGLLLIAFLLAMHLAESRIRLGVLRPQAPMLAGGVALAVLAGAAAALPAGPAATGYGWLAALSAIAAIIAAALALPV
ncbi:MAG TPA: hypothetical protein VFQ44_23885 [Streptosporangiaceae bacterium]|nr:hypothetical protein [Streptosporangiaceae bacterium]